MVESSNAEQEVQTKTCGLCKTQIEVAKFRLHEIGCIRQ